jgi:nucleoside-specific outer membrane channel protein Tsx
MTLAGVAKRGWVFKSDLLAAGYLDYARRKLKETQQRERNGKRTAQGIAVENKKRTAAKNKKQYQKRTPEQTDATELRRRAKRAE